MGDYFPRCAPAQMGVDAARLLELCAELQKPRYGLQFAVAVARREGFL